MMYGKWYCENIKEQSDHLAGHLGELTRIVHKMHLPEELLSEILYHIRTIKYCNQQIGYCVEDFFNPTNIKVYKDLCKLTKTKTEL